MIMEIMIICALTNTAPFYDCSENWTITIWDDVIPPACKPDEGVIAVACANWYSTGKQEIHLTYLSAVQNPHTTDVLRDKWGMTYLNHEIKHLKCLCNFHQTLEESLKESRERIEGMGY